MQLIGILIHINSPKNIQPIEFTFPQIKTSLFRSFNAADIDEIISKSSLSYIVNQEESEDYLYALSGKLNGLDLAEVVTTGYGQTGASKNMIIRGVGSINSQQEALQKI